jgi:hypothetical protein
MLNVYRTEVITTHYGLKEKFPEHLPANVLDTFSLSIIQIAETCAAFSINNDYNTVFSKSMNFV